MQLQVTEIFKSIQGESSLSGTPCVFIRLTGCNLRCRYCDTVYAYEGGDWLSIDDILSKVDDYKCNLVEITGGEPLLQNGVYLLISALLKTGKSILIETNGSIDIERVQGFKGLRIQGLKIIMDIKCPDSGMSERMNWGNLDKLYNNDEVKFVINSRGDYDWSKEIIKKYSLADRCHILMSPVYDNLTAEELSEWILNDNLNVRLNLQIHKYIWGESVKGV
ncbi:MAG: 7-carboxy-7-deazaguanine synthase [Nitrospinae bacterium RIFCSPLOWO2_12_39_16]|nr:MAG: 7-carboxy-7-deazaguanine synthase [Nitrospinae bacterium RIFCSPLOWO2_12_39_16]HLA48709.1 radical SAM protein [Nitrospinota bacterium]